MKKGRNSRLDAGTFIGMLLYCALSAIILWSPPAGATVTTPVVTEIVFDITAPPGDQRALSEMARDLIFIHTGEPFSPARMEHAIEALKLSNVFQEIHVDSEEDEKGMTLRFSLKPFRLVKDVVIEKAYPLFEREILNAMTIYPGDVFTNEELSAQKTLIEELYRWEGYVAPTVEMEATEDPADGIVVHARIEKGPFYRLERFDIAGNESVSDTAVRTRMKVWLATFLPGSGSRFIEKDLKNDIKGIIKYYRSRGFFEASADYTVTRNVDRQTVSLLLTIDEGPRYTVAFSGNEEFWDLTLRKDLVFLKEGNRGNRGVRKSLRNIRERYEAAGYLNAVVKAEEATPPDAAEARIVRIVIEEGPRTMVQSIEVRGNRAIDTERIRKQMLTRVPGIRDRGVYVPGVLQDDLMAIKALYLKEGFMDATVEEAVELSHDGKNAAISLVVDEGVRTMVSSVTISGITAVSEEEALAALSMKQGDPFRQYLLRPGENELSAPIAEKGYPHVTVREEVKISEDKREAVVAYFVDEGPPVFMGNIYVTGNFRTKKRIIDSEIDLEPGEPFSLARMLKGQRNIRNMDIFQSVRFKTIGLKEKEERISLLAEVEEKKPYFLQAGGGYESQRGFFGHVKGGDHNLFGTRKNAWIGGDLSQIGYRTDLGITEPSLFGSSISTTFSLFAERRQEFNQNFGTQVYGSSLVLHRRWFERITTNLGVRYERREQFLRDGDDTDETVLSAEELVPRSILVTTPTVRYDSRDSFIRPRKGLFSSFSVDISAGLLNSLDNFLRYRLDTRWFITPFEGLTLAFAGRGGFIQAYGEAGDIPDDQLFFLGGTLDVRGFSENMLLTDAAGDPLGGRAALSGSVEGRYDLGYNFELACFYDTGTVRDSVGEVRFNTFRSSVGLGLRYNTPIGPIGILYGHKLDRKDGEDAGRFHFSIGYTF